MQYNKTNLPEISLLRNSNAGICITVIAPVDPALQKANKVTLNKMLRRTNQALIGSYKPEEIKELMEVLNDMATNLLFEPCTEGVGLYVSPTIKRIVYFPFAVQERIKVSDHFELRELMYKEDYADPYCVLLVTEKHARLFNGTWNQLNEVKDRHFPVANNDEYIYTKPAPGSSASGYASVKSVEKDKSEVESIRLKDFFRHVDKGLTQYLISGRPLIVVAVKKDLSFFEEISSHAHHIIGKAEGDYDYSSNKELAAIVWPMMLTHLKQNRLALLEELEEKTGAGLSIPGVHHSWTAAREGKSLKLLVEKDYRRPGYLSDDESHLYLRPPRNASRIIADAVEDVIETVLEKKGEVHFFDNGELKQYDHIATIARYK